MYLLRHGQSEFNVHFAATRIDPGIEDPALTEIGRDQARAAAEALSTRGLTRIVASPYRRTLETASVLAERLGLPVEIDSLVRERCWFVCDVGTPASLLRTQWPTLDFDRLGERWWPAQGESEAQLAARCGVFASRLHRATDWGETVYVSHWGFIRGLTGLAVGNGTVVELRPGPDASVVHAPEP
ncbi:histidine phosphatase family protein [Thalassobaculum sp.]|uniref:histidine phosphatase family protein n=1 Tax=Thalassobaculum sp. TaxID=2022740 RepID=UPI0032EDBB76